MYPRFIAFWCSEGLESIVDVYELEREQLLKVLGSVKIEKIQPLDKMLGSMIGSMIFRARHNLQRHYEIYAFDADDTVTKEMLEESFNETPQEMAETIRKKGVILYSDRMVTKPVIT